MPRNVQVLLDYEIKRRPHLAQLAAGLATLTEDDIRAAALPLPWMRQALLDRKRRRAHDALAAALDACVIDGVAPDPTGEMRRWEGPDSYVKVGRSSLEVRSGQLVWLDTDGIWIDSIHVRVVDPLLLRQSVSCGPISRSGYMAAVAARARQLCPVETTSAPMPVRFYRPG